MDGQLRHRGVMTAAGALAGGICYLLFEAVKRGALSGYPALALSTLALVFFAALLIMVGPTGLRRAALSAGGLALVVAGLAVLANLRFADDDGLFHSEMLVLAVLVLAFLPQPFLIAAAGPGWRDYPTLFSEAWSIVIRYAAAGLFVGLVWLLLMLCDQFLSMVGIGVIGWLVSSGPAMLLISGAALGLAIAVIDEMADSMSPSLVLRLLRVLLPVVLAVLVLFLALLPVRGLDGLFGRLSAAATLLVMAGVSATLVTSALDRSEAEQTRNALVLRAAQAMALLVPAPAALAAWAVWVRVAQHGWTPDRVFAACAVVLGLGYGLLYLLAVLRGAGWTARVRQANVTMALVLIAMAAALLTPLLDPQAISVRSQLARLDDGSLAPEDFPAAEFARWGRAGEEALTALRLRAAEPGQEMLAHVLQGAQQEWQEPDPVALRAELVRLLPVQPPTAAPLRDRLLAALDPSTLAMWRDACRTPIDDAGTPGCALIAADFRPDLPGDEAMLFLWRPWDALEVTVHGWRGDERDERNAEPRDGDARPYGDAAKALLRAAQTEAAPHLVPVTVQALHLGGIDLVPRLP
ncbi:MAG: DUF4153 domain-containing protein [Gemmobacter sp.]|jgi:hypothetical protein|nr:DUF4153 domain-containing protein [Gemmobacter sp.]